MSNNEQRSQRPRPILGSVLQATYIKVTNTIEVVIPMEWWVEVEFDLDPARMQWWTIPSRDKTEEQDGQTVEKCVEHMLLVIACHGRFYRMTEGPNQRWGKEELRRAVRGVVVNLMVDPEDYHAKPQFWYDSQGNSIYNDEMSVVDANGKPVLDDNGNPVVELTPKAVRPFDLFQQEAWDIHRSMFSNVRLVFPSFRQKANAVKRFNSPEVRAWRKKHVLKAATAPSNNK